MLLKHPIILLGLNAASFVLCVNPEYSDHGVSISDPIFATEHESLSFTNLHPTSDADITTWPENDEDKITKIHGDQHENHPHSDTLTAAQAATNSSTESANHMPADSLPEIWAVGDDLGDDISMSLSTPPFFATDEPFDRSTASVPSPSSTTPSIVPSTRVPNPAKAALDWLTSTSYSICLDGKSATLTSSTGSTSPTTTTSTKTTDPAKAALDWLTSGVDDKSATPATTTDSKHSSIVSGILSDLDATHTSTAAANRVRFGF